MMIEMLRQMSFRTWVILLYLWIIVFFLLCSILILSGWDK